MTIYIQFKSGDFHATTDAPEDIFINSAYEDFLSDVAEGSAAAYDGKLSVLRDVCRDKPLLKAISGDSGLDPADFQRRIDALIALLDNV